MLRLVCAVFLAFPAAAVFAADYRLLRLDGFILKWDTPDLGAGADVSYGFAASPLVFPDAINCGELAPMAELGSVWGNDVRRLERLTAEAFAMWSGAADIVFRRAAAGEHPDILIGAQARPRHVAFANVWHDAASARDGVAPLTRATICFNPEVDWAIGDLSTDRPDLRTVLAHEVGHAIGLDHPGATGALMGFEDQGPRHGLEAGDVAGALALYGPRPVRVAGQP